MKDNGCLFTVVIPLYNKSEYILRAVNSVIQQTYRGFEVIVVDDGSNDNGAEIVKNIEDDRIRLICQKNAGVSAARNKGIENASYEYIAFLDADDEWHPKFLESIISLIVAYPNAGLYATAFEISTDQGNKIPKFIDVPKGVEGGVLRSYFRSAAFNVSPVWSSAACIPKSIFAKIGVFPIGEKLGEDLDMWSRVALRYPIAYCSYIGAVYHVLAGNRICISSLPQNELPFCKRLQEKIDSRTVPTELVDEVRLFIARHLIHVASINIQHGSKSVAKDVLLDRRTNLFLTEKLILSFCLIVPQKLIILGKALYKKVHTYFGPLATFLRSIP